MPGFVGVDATLWRNRRGYGRFASRCDHAFGSDTSRFGSRGGTFISAVGFQPVAFMASKTWAMFSMSWL